MTSISATSGDDLWAITCYFNPARFRRRRETYGVFREHLAIPLVAVELALGGDYELGEEDAEILVRVGGGDVLWQKERLLNLAIEALPEACEKVAWLDCDVVFEDADWHARTRRLLDAFPLVQPFSHVWLTGPDWMPTRPAPRTTPIPSVPRLIRSGTPKDAFLATSRTDIRFSTGHAWAATRELLGAHGLYDACVIGGGDITLARAAYGEMEFAVGRQFLNREHYLAWAAPFHDAVRSRVGCVEGGLFHLWHGDVANRRYWERNVDFSRFAFDPNGDIALNAGGAWRWSSDKPDMHAYVKDYFASRREDG